MEKQTKFVSWTVFAWVVGIIFLILGILITSDTALSNKLDLSQKEELKIQTQLSQIQTDIQWIKQALEK